MWVAAALVMAWTPPTALRAPSRDLSLHCHRAILMCDGASSDKQMSSDVLVTYAEVTDDFKELMVAALGRLDKNRLLQGKPKYETVEGMIDAYVEEAAKAGLGWTRAEAESEVVRYLKRQALVDEGGGTSLESGADGIFIGIFALIVIWGAIQGYAPAQSWPAQVVSPY